LIIFYDKSNITAYIQYLLKIKYISYGEIFIFLLSRQFLSRGLLGQNKSADVVKQVICLMCNAVCG